MIRTEVGLHDSFSVEFKTGFLTDNKLYDINEFKVNTWIFLPNSLDVNSSTYSKDQFYKDIKKNVRLITPIYSLSEIINTNRGPFDRLQKAITALQEKSDDEKITEQYAYQIKMLNCIITSALRRESDFIVRNTNDAQVTLLVKKFTSNVRAIANEYRAKWLVLEDEKFAEKQKNFYRFGNDYLGNIIEQYCFYILKGIAKRTVYESAKSDLIDLIEDEKLEKIKNGDDLVGKEKGKINSAIISKRNLLKKFMESDLFLKVERKKDGVIAEQVYYSIAAGLAMTVATIFSYFANQRYESYTTGLFILLIIGYMLKDRVKDLARYYFLNSMSKKYFDTKLKLSIRNQEIGWIKESFDFVNESKLSEDILCLRERTPLVEAQNNVYNEQVILYRKWLSLSKHEIEKYKEYKLSGINDITRFNLNHFTQKMDNPYKMLSVLNEEKNVESFEATRIYSIHFVIHCQSDFDEYFKAYRVSLNRNGITDVKELN